MKNTENASPPAAPAQSGEPVAVEVWHGERKVTIYPDCVLRVWGANIESEMSDEPRTLQTVQDAMNWLYAAPQPTLPAKAGEPITKEWCLKMAALEPDEGVPPAGLGAVALDDERAAFEAWWNRDVPESSRSMIPYLMDHDASGKYANPRSEGAWEVWQAARAGLIGQHHRDSAELRRLCKARDNARVAFEARIAELESDRNSWRALAESAKRDLSTCAAFPQATKGDERSRFEQALRETYQMVDPLNPPPAGSYRRGEFEGIIAALKTIRENFDRVAAPQAVATQPVKE